MGVRNLIRKNSQGYLLIFTYKEYFHQWYTVPNVFVEGSLQKTGKLVQTDVTFRDALAFLSERKCEPQQRFTGRLTEKPASHPWASSFLICQHPQRLSGSNYRLHPKVRSANEPNDTSGFHYHIQISAVMFLEIANYLSRLDFYLKANLC